MRAAELIEQTPSGRRRTVISEEEAREIIQKECTQAYAAYKKGLVAYRGLAKDNESIYYLGATGINRPPKDSVAELQKMIDRILLDHLGPDAAVRSNSMFAIGNIHIASEYGHPFKVFPKDSVKITYSRRLRDLVLSTDVLEQFLTRGSITSSLPSYHKFEEILKNKGLPTDSSQPFVEELRHWRKGYLMDYHQYNHAGTMRVLQNQPQEIKDAAAESGLIEDLTLLSLTPRSLLIPRLTEMGLAKFDENKFIQDYFQPVTDDWEGAVASKKEIYIKGEYVLVKHDYAKPNLSI